MFSAAQKVKATRVARLYLAALCIGVIATLATAQGPDVFGPPTAMPSPIPETVTTQAKNIDTPSVPSRNPAGIEHVPVKAERTPQLASPKRESPLLGNRTSSSRDLAQTESDSSTDAKLTKGMGKTAWATSVVLALIIAAALGVRAIAKRQGGLMAAIGPGGRAPGGLLEVLGRFPISRGQTLVLLKIDQRVLLLSQSAGGRLGTGAGMTTLCEITDAEEVASILMKSQDEGSESLTDRFRSMLAGHTRQGSLPGAGAVLSAGRLRFESDAGDSTEMWDESQAAEAIVDQADAWPTANDGSAIGSLRSRLEHWRDVEATG